jgi:hypothetical protein
MAAAAIAIAVQVGGATSASAVTYATHGSDRSWTDGGIRIWVQDREADNHGVYANYITRNGGTFQVGDPNGSASPAGTELSEDGSVIIAYQTCEHTQGCGAWV